MKYLRFLGKFLFCNTTKAFINAGYGFLKDVIADIVQNNSMSCLSCNLNHIHTMHQAPSLLQQKQCKQFIACQVSLRCHNKNKTHY